jgi:kinetochore protein NDC80
MAHAEENKRITVSNMAETVDLQKQVQGSANIPEEEKSIISTLQAKHDKVSPSLQIVHCIL